LCLRHRVPGHFSKQRQEKESFENRVITKFLLPVLPHPLFGPFWTILFAKSNNYLADCQTTMLFQLWLSTQPSDFKSVSSAALQVLFHSLNWSHKTSHSKIALTNPVKSGSSDPDD
jgi:hypothetical protein